MRHLTKGRVLVLVGLLIALALVIVGRWMNANKIGGQGPAEPFRIAGNFYYVGATDVAAFLITGPEGHVVLDGGYPTTARLIMASIAKLGFDIKDVKVLLNSEAAPRPRGRADGASAGVGCCSCGPATRAPTPSPPAATTPTASCR